MCIANTVAAAALVVRLAPLIPTIWWLHEAEIGLANLLRNPSQLAGFELAGAVVFQTEFQRNDVYRSFVFALPPEKLHIIPNGVSLETPVPLPTTPDVLRVVSVGTVYGRKRHSDLIAAVALLRSQLDVELVICGEVQDGLDAKAQASLQIHSGRMRLTGEVERTECLAWMASADIFCLASDSESQPLTVLEAALLGKPLVLSDLRCYADVYRHGMNCLSFPVGDVGLLSHALGALAADAGRRRQLGQAARATARRFSEAGMLARFGALIENLAAADL